MRSGDAAMVREEKEDNSELYLLDAADVERDDVADQHPELVADLRAKLDGFFEDAKALPQ